jgi:hypothetical protein
LVIRGFLTGLFSKQASGDGFQIGDEADKVHAALGIAIAIAAFSPLLRCNIFFCDSAAITAQNMGNGT